MPNVLVVDDEPQRTEYLKRELSGTSEDAYKIEQVACWDELLGKLRREYQRLQLVIFDVDFRKIDEEKGLTLFSLLSSEKKKFPPPLPQLLRCPFSPSIPRGFLSIPPPEKFLE